MFIKNLTKIIVISIVGACTVIPVPASIDDAEVFHWENEYVTMEKFITDHKSCLGVTKQQTRTQMSSLFNNMAPSTVPKWDGLWATFESRSHKEVGQRIAFSVPSGVAANTNAGTYKRCMELLNYRLTYRRY